MATAPAYSLEDIAMPLLKIRILDCTERISGFVVAIAGLLISLWANCVMVIVCTQDHYRKVEMFTMKTIIQTSQLTHLIVVLTATAGLYYGLKERNRTLLPLWMLLKVLELITLFIGSILICIGGRQSYIGVMPVALCFLVLGCYILMCVCETYGKMDITTRSSSFEEVNLDIAPGIPIPKDPPSYDSYINQTNNIPANTGRI